MSVDKSGHPFGSRVGEVVVQILNIELHKKKDLVHFLWTHK